MDLFEKTVSGNLLPYDGEAYYFDHAISADEQATYFHQLLHEVEWKPDEVVIFGKRIVTKRETAWFALDGLTYTYSNITRQATPFSQTLLNLKQLAESLSRSEFNACLLNLYHSGEEGMSWHADNEKELGKDPAIASISLGAERKFSFKHRLTKQTISLSLKAGSLLLMKGACQQHWLHSLPKSKKAKGARINLTFRRIIP